jgi:hypothetical protein
MLVNSLIYVAHWKSSGEIYGTNIFVKRIFLDLCSFIFWIQSVLVFGYWHVSKFR